MERTKQRGMQHIALTTAAATVRIKMSGLPPDPRDQQAMWKVLDETAHALSLIISIYVADGLGLPKELSHAELLSGSFSRGGQLFTSAKGKEWRGLSVRRSDMEFAITILKSIAK
jgi:hypothetical protein